MTTTAIVRSPTAHLRTHRTLVLTRSILSGVVGVVPVPYIDDLLAGAVRAQLIRKLADLRQVDVDGNAVHALSEPSGSRVLSAAGLGVLAVGTARPTWRRLMSRLGTSLLLVRRLDETIETFHVGTLFDHYCLRHHVGAGLDGKRALLLRHAIDLAASRARTDLIRGAFQRGLGAAMKNAGKVKLGAEVLERLRRGKGAAAAGVESAGEAFSAEAKELEAQLGAVEGGYLSGLLERFEVSWSAVQAARPIVP